MHKSQPEMAHAELRGFASGGEKAVIRAYSCGLALPITSINEVRGQFSVMAGLVPAIQVVRRIERKRVSN